MNPFKNKWTLLITFVASILFLSCKSASSIQSASKKEKCSLYASAVKDDSYGVINEFNNVVIPFSKDTKTYVADIDHSTSQTPFFTFKKEPNQWGFINTKGEIKFVFQGNHLGLFHNHLASIKSLKKTGYVDTSFQLVIDSVYFSVRPFSSGRALVQKDSAGNWGVINKSGQLIFDYLIDKAHYPPHGFTKEGVFPVKIDGLYGIIDTMGNYVVKPSYQNMHWFSDGLVKVRLKDNVIAFLNAEGKQMFSSSYPEIRKFSEGLAAFNVGGTYDTKSGLTINGRWGYIDTNGKVIIPAKHSDVGPFQEGLAYVKGIKGYGFINKNATIIIPPFYDTVSNFQNGLAVVIKDGKYGAIDQSGNIVIPLEYQFLTNFVK